ncbi:hypothetical protein A9Q94_11870 [Rhodobacterales bacterium 56_14_T64]|nr:hypothetical protein A9Q94_11870 [Rhodobacterales bacterium 56_14_T64]
MLRNHLPGSGTIRVNRKLDSTEVIDALTDWFILHGVPEYIRSELPIEVEGGYPVDQWPLQSTAAAFIVRREKSLGLRTKGSRNEWRGQNSSVTRPFLNNSIRKLAFKRHTESSDLAHSADNTAGAVIVRMANSVEKLLLI